MRRFLLAALLLLLSLAGSARLTTAQAPVVRAVLFYSTTCPHCQEVMTNVLPPIQARYGAQFELRKVEISDRSSGELYLAALRQYQVPQDLWVVPFLVLGKSYMIGSDQISQRLTAEIDRGLAAGGIDYPTLPTPAPTSPVATAAPTATPTPLPLGLKGQPLGAVTAAVLALGMIGALLATGLMLWRGLRPVPEPVLPQPTRRKSKHKPAPIVALPRPGWAILAVLLVGLAAALYLSYIEVTHGHAYCGPLSDCDLVQSSAYAKIQGLPVAFLGLGGYVSLLAAWSVSRWGPQPWVLPGAQALVALALGGTLFSIYLTYLEAFVIGAVCPWCLTSAVCMALAMLLAARFVTRPGLG